ncbi:MAG TPA: hypothetical protein VMY78_16010 [Solirubrobacteraceae bacterium]|nr:hypothetical protein [Solirubrobacteraceae bacterium]
MPDDLYGLPLARFIPERGALAKALRAEGRRDEAADVAKLRKPSAAAWAVNQLVRTQGRAVSELFDAGDAVRAAQSGVLAGKGDAAALRDAGARERAAVSELAGIARGLLSEQGQELSATTLERLADTLHAAALDDASREQVRDGRLERELQHIGLGLGEGPAVARAAPAPAPAPAPAKTKRTAAERAEEKRAAKERAAAEQAERKAARAAAAAAAKRAARAQAALQAAQERRERALAALAEADEALEAAAAEAEEARAALE